MVPLKNSRRIPSTIVLDQTSPFRRTRTNTGPNVLRLVIRYVFYAFIFTIPFESIGFAADYLSLSKITGLLLGLTAILSPRMCFRRLPRAILYFSGYLSVVALMFPFQESQFFSSIISRIITTIQLLFLFWISYNLMQDERTTKRTLLTVIMSCTILAILMLLGVGADLDGRDTALGTNPNLLAAVLSLGLLALLGLAFGRQKGDMRAFILLALCAGILLIEIARTGSRGGAIALIVGVLVFPLKKTRRLASKVQLVIVGALAVSFLLWTSYRSETVRERWERTFATGETSGRDRIFSESWDMFLEKPLLGWGPVTHLYELGSRLGLPFRDPHNLYLWVLTETGLVGFIPFLIGLWLCLRASWKARAGPQGVLPLALLLSLLINNMQGTLIDNKLFWFVLAYALASNYPLQFQFTGSRLRTLPTAGRMTPW